MKLYQLPISPFSARIRIIAAEKRVPLELCGPGGGAPGCPGLASVHPLSHSPVLIDGTLAIADTGAIAEYLDERFPAPPMMPVSPADRARARALVRFHDTVLGPAIADAYTNIRAGGRNASDAEHVETQLVSFERRIDPQPWLFGDRFGIADAAFCMSVWYAVQITHAAGHPLDEAKLPRVLAWFASASHRMSVALVLRDAQESLDPSLVTRLCDPIWFGATGRTEPADEGLWSTSAA